LKNIAKVGHVVEGDGGGIAGGYSYGQNSGRTLNVNKEGATSTPVVLDADGDIAFRKSGEVGAGGRIRDTLQIAAVRTKRVDVEFEDGAVCFMITGKGDFGGIRFPGQVEDAINAGIW
jgi:hypothetical protein